MPNESRTILTEENGIQDLSVLPVRVKVDGSTIAAFEDWEVAAAFVAHLSDILPSVSWAEASIHFTYETI